MGINGSSLHQSIFAAFEAVSVTSPLQECRKITRFYWAVHTAGFEQIEKVYEAQLVLNGEYPSHNVDFGLTFRRSVGKISPAWVLPEVIVKMTLQEKIKGRTAESVTQPNVSHERK